MTKKEAIAIALNTVTDTDAREVLSKMYEQLSKPHSTSEDAKMKRKEATAKARGELVSQVAPILRKHLTTPLTAKELFEVAKGELPKDFSAPKVQNILIREMKPELSIVETKGKANTYCLIQ